MIGRLRGTLVEKQPPYLLLDVGGVGYELQAPMTTFYKLPALGAEVVLHTHLSITENLHQLFAFFDQRDRALFRTLIKVNGVGPKLAIAILSGMEADDIARCVRESALIALGYKPVDAAKMIANAAKQHQNANSQELIRLALRSIAPA
jgi:Holliday junction DNA helicase RuvA